MGHLNFNCVCHLRLEKTLYAVEDQPLMRTVISGQRVTLRGQRYTILDTLHFTNNIISLQAGGLISVKATGSLNNVYPPGRVSDLILGSMNFTENTFGLSFTWPGNQLDQGTVASFKVQNKMS